MTQPQGDGTKVNLAARARAEQIILDSKRWTLEPSLMDVRFNPSLSGGSVPFEGTTLKEGFASDDEKKATAGELLKLLRDAAWKKEMVTLEAISSIPAASYNQEEAMHAVEKLAQGNGAAEAGKNGISREYLITAPVDAIRQARRTIRGALGKGADDQEKKGDEP